MNYSGEAADQVVRMTIQGAEVALRLTGSAAERLAVLIYAIMKDQHRTAGKMRLGSMLKSGKELNVFTIPAKDLSAFAAEAKKYGVLYCALKEKKTGENTAIDVMVYKEDAAKINRIVERLSLATVKTSEITEAEKTPENPMKTGREENIRSGPTLKTGEKTVGGIPDTPRRSVRKDIEELREWRRGGSARGEEERFKGQYLRDANRPQKHIQNGRIK